MAWYERGAGRLLIAAAAAVFGAFALGAVGALAGYWIGLVLGGADGLAAAGGFLGAIAGGVWWARALPRRLAAAREERAGS